MQYVGIMRSVEFLYVEKNVAFFCVVQQVVGVYLQLELGKKVDNHSGWLSGFAINKSDSLRAGA